MPKVNDNFYHNLPINKLQLSKLLIKSAAFTQVPANWQVIITDIKGSTQAVMGGLNETVNFIATSSIVAVLNLAYKSGITIPFFFGGDGATFIVPSSLVEPAMKSLLLFKANTLANFQIDLRVGTVTVAEVYDAGHEINISKFAISDFFSIPVVLGDGLNYAENLIKAEDYAFNQEDEIFHELDLNGMQCRWDKIPPPENVNEIVTLLVVSPQIEKQAEAYSKVISLIDEIYGGIKKRQPISIDKLKLKTTFNRLSTEMRARIGKVRFLELIRNWFVNSFGKLYFLTASGKRYLNKLVEMSDTLVMDGKINTVICGSEKQRLALTEKLELLEKSGDIIFGLYVSQESVMSCYVRDLKDAHIHFVDGADGGYTQAARILKGKLAD